MSDKKLTELQGEALELERKLTELSDNNDEAKVALNYLTPYIRTSLLMEKYEPMGDLKIDYLFIEGELSKYEELTECYFRFSVLSQGINL